MSCTFRQVTHTLVVLDSSFIDPFVFHLALLIVHIIILRVLYVYLVVVVLHLWFKHIFPVDKADKISQQTLNFFGAEVSTVEIPLLKHDLNTEFLELCHEFGKNEFKILDDDFIIFDFVFLDEGNEKVEYKFDVLLGF